MSLKYTCPSCGTPLGYEGLCWKCKCEQERQAALAWMPEQIVEKQRNLIQNIQRLADMEDPEFADFWQLLGYHDAITPEIQRVALAAEVFWPCEIYYHAPADVRDGLIHALLSTEDSSEASNLMCCLAFQGDGRALETLLELENHPRSWRKKLYVDPSIYAQCGGWTFNKKGQRTQLNFDTCFSFVKGAPGEVSPVRIGRAREDTCPHCGGHMVDMLVLDGRDLVVPGYENGFFVGPTILDHVKPGMTVGDREIFGPVTIIKRVKTFEEGLAIMNANPFANGSVIFTQSGYYARQFELLTDGGMGGINVGIPVPSAYFPFSGNKDSFFGDLHVLGQDGVRFYTRAKTVTKHWYSEHSHKKTVDTWEGTVERI